MEPIWQPLPKMSKAVGEGLVKGSVEDNLKLITEALFGLFGDVKLNPGTCESKVTVPVAMVSATGPMVAPTTA